MRACFCLGALSVAGVDMDGQISPFDSSFFHEAELIRERVDCFTDRSLYITEEVIRFRADVHRSGLPAYGEWSAVLYVELISATGEREVSGKFPVHDRVSTGEIAIPAEILTGNYLLRCHTRWMRNRGPADYCYVPLRIINPHRPEISGKAPVEETGGSLSTRSVTQGALEFSEHSIIYNRADTVSLHISADGKDFNGIVKGCVTVVPSGVKPVDPQQVVESQTQDLQDFQVKFMPDYFGATLSGTVLQSGTDEQIVEDIRIHFTLMGDHSGYFTARSDAYGKFTVTLPHREGKLELFVQPEYPGVGRVEVRIDQDFDQRMLLLPTQPFRLSEKEEELVSTMARKVQLSRIYGKVDSIIKSKMAYRPNPFYGSPNFSINMGDFILLPTLEEVFMNLVPSVTPVTRKNIPSLFIRSDNPAISMFDPLIMIDETPVFDMDQFMKVPTHKISKIDVIDDVYLKGDLRYGGIINLHSLEMDMAGIDLPENSFFIDFLAMHPSPNMVEETPSLLDQLPDTRNTMLWIPKLQVESNSPSLITFIAPDYPGEYVILFRGVNGRGELISAESVIRVR